MIELSGLQWTILFNSFSLAMVGLLSLTLYIVGTQSRILFKYRNSVVVVSAISFNALLFYILIFSSFINSSDGNTLKIGLSHGSFNETLRFGEWIIGVPLQLIAILSILSIPRKMKGQLLAKLIPVSLSMVMFGFAAEISSTMTARLVLGSIAVLPLIYTIKFLYSRVTEVLDSESADVALGFARLRLVLFLTWSLYPVIFLVQSFQLNSPQNSTLFVATQMGYTIADLTSKAGISLLVVSLAHTLSESAGTPAQL
jgi:bacteriorhodopsin